VALLLLLAKLFLTIYIFPSSATSTSRKNISVEWPSSDHVCKRKVCVIGIIMKVFCEGSEGSNDLSALPSLPLCSLHALDAGSNQVEEPPMLSFRDSIPMDFFKRLTASHDCPDRALPP
jgi:hypothetical protein